MMQNCPKSCGFCEEGDYLNYFNKFILEITELIDYRVSVGRTLQKYIWDNDGEEILERIFANLSGIGLSRDIISHVFSVSDEKIQEIVTLRAIEST